MKRPISETKRPATKTSQPAVSSETSLKSRARLRDHFFRRQIDPTQLLQPLDHLPGILYFVKDAQSRLMAISGESVVRMGFHDEAEIIGRTVGDYLPAHLADKYLADDQWVIRHGKPLQNLVEMFFNEQGLPDWIVTDKYPVRDVSGQVVGLIGTVQTFAARHKMLALFGAVGKAADFIREHLGEPVMLADIARHAGLSQRQLQRLFRRAFGLTMQQFIIQSRVQAAIHVLTHSERPIAEIAVMFGFSDQSAFTNKLRAVTGLTPRLYRERYLAKLIP